MNGTGKSLSRNLNICFSQGADSNGFHAVLFCDDRTAVGKLEIVEANLIASGGGQSGDSA
jgi:hypothetical protein